MSDQSRTYLTYEEKYGKPFYRPAPKPESSGLGNKIAAIAALVFVPTPASFDAVKDAFSD